MELWVRAAEKHFELEDLETLTAVSRFWADFYKVR